MAAAVVYTWDAVDSGQSVNVFIHGYGDNEAVNYCLVLGQFGPVTITQVETYKHVDNTAARKVYIQNNTPTWSVRINLIEMTETF
jgi:hypothetical protein